MKQYIEYFFIYTSKITTLLPIVLFTLRFKLLYHRNRTYQQYKINQKEEVGTIYFSSALSL